MNANPPALRRKNDPADLNKLFNIGYHFLSKKVEQELERKGLWPEIGLLHATRNKNKPLVYDLMELFRQPTVDLPLIHLMRQWKKPHRIEAKEIRKFIYRLKQYWQTKEVHLLINQEVEKVFRLVRYGEIYIPLRWKWGHKKKKT